MNPASRFLVQKTQVACFKVAQDTRFLFANFSLYLRWYQYVGSGKAEYILFGLRLHIRQVCLRRKVVQTGHVYGMAGQIQQPFSDVLIMDISN